MKAQFPIFSQKTKTPITYLDSAATSQIPRCVLDSITNYYQTSHANINRGVHFLGERATAEYESARKCVGNFINASEHSQIVFTGGTTHSVNFIARSFTEKRLNKDDIILVSPLDHHSNLLPWLTIARENNAKVQFCKLNGDNNIDVESIPFENPKLKMIAITHVSNVTGGIQPVEHICKRAAKHQIPVLIDGAQAAAHLSVDVSAINPGFYVFSGHKMYAMTGIGVCYISSEYADKINPYMSGGGMVDNITADDFTPLLPPQKWEAGTPHIAGAVSIGSAVEFILKHKLLNKQAHTKNLLNKAIAGLQKIPGIKLYSNITKNTGIISFSHALIHPHDLSAYLSDKGICIRAGHHCAKPFMNLINEHATCRLSLACYNDENDINRFLDGVTDAVRFFG